MTRRLLLLLLALGLGQIAYTQICCSFEPPDCEEGACELCHLVDILPLSPGSALPGSPPPTLRAALAPSQGWSIPPFPRRNSDRAPPR